MLEEYTIALGGVATGSMNAQLDASATPEQSSTNGRLNSNENVATIGINRLTNARFDINSVANTVIVIRSKIITTIEDVLNALK